MVCGVIAIPGLLILCRCLYFTVVYGQGDPLAGEFTLCEYQAYTGETVRTWSYDVSESTEDPPFKRLSTWFVGFVFLLLGGGIYLIPLEKNYCLGLTMAFSEEEKKGLIVFELGIDF